jgi:DNA-binding SARP family transcriptional activator
VLANVHAMRQLTIDGPEREVRRRLRAYALEVATTRIAGPVQVVVAGDERLASLEEIRLVDDPTGEVAAALAEHDQQIMLDDRLPRLLLCHDGVAPPAIPDELDVLVGLARAGPRENAGWHLDVADIRGWLQLPAGTTVELALPAADPDLIDDELTRLEPDTDPRPAPPAPAATREVEPSSNGHPPPVTVRHVDPAWCEIRLLGPVEVIRNGQVITGDITPLCLQVLAYLATHRSGVTGEQLEDAVWAGRAARAGSQRVRGVLSRLRHALGEGPDGKALIPPRQAGSTAPIQLSDHLGCDLDRAFTHLATARDLNPGQRIGELSAALALIRGEPFEGLPVTWATDIQQRAITQLQDAAVEVAVALREAGDYDQAEDAIHRGLQLCDPAEPLYVEWAHLEAARGHRDQIPRLWQRLRNRYAQDADEAAGWVATPTADTELTFQTLMTPTWKL